MPDSIPELNTSLQPQTGRNKSLWISLAAFFFVSIVMVLAVWNYLNLRRLNNNEMQTETQSELKPVESTKYEGKVLYLDPKMYPNQNISYYLGDADGKQIALLRASDKKLEVVEGFNVVVFGRKIKNTNTKEDVIQVDRILIKNSGDTNAN